jgi:hypothetical protein
VVSTLPKSREHERVTVFHLDIVGNLSAQHFAPFIETIDWNQASAFLESVSLGWRHLLRERNLASGVVLWCNGVWQSAGGS